MASSPRRSLSSCIRPCGRCLNCADVQPDRAFLCLACLRAWGRRQWLAARQRAATQDLSARIIIDLTANCPAGQIHDYSSAASDDQPDRQWLCLYALSGLYPGKYIPDQPRVLRLETLAPPRTLEESGRANTPGLSLFVLGSEKTTACSSSRIRLIRMHPRASQLKTHRSRRKHVPVPCSQSWEPSGLHKSLTASHTC